MSAQPDMNVVDEIPSFPGLDPAQARSSFPPLNKVQARSIIQDRWERLAATIEIPEKIELVWRKLTNPEDIGHWLATCPRPVTSSDAEFMLDFDDGEFFYCQTEEATGPDKAGEARWRYLWRWVGVGPVTRVTWKLARSGANQTSVTAIEEAVNPPSDWRAWNGNGWPGILDQLAGYMRTGTTHRWPWRRMGPYVQIELDATPYDAWELLSKPEALRYWLQRRYGSFTTGDKLTLVMGDASGIIEMDVHRHVEPNQQFPSYLPWLEFGLRRPHWDVELGGKLYIEQTSVNHSLFQIFAENWDQIPVENKIEERKIIATFFRDSMVRAQNMFLPRPEPSRQHGWA